MSTSKIFKQVDAVADAVLVENKFFWPHGGSDVFISGSFTRWSFHWPMPRMDNYPTIFEVICHLTPGFHQYKFCVDGEWKHDEHQPFVMGNYGIVNTVFITENSEPMASLLSLGTPSIRINMDVDNEACHLGQAKVPECSMKSLPISISDADVKISRDRVCQFLSTHTAYDLLPDSGKVVALDVNLPVKQAFHILYEQGIPVAPLWDFNIGKFVGVLSALDFILILRELGNRGSNLSEEELEIHTILAWKVDKQQMSGQVNEHVRPFERHLVHASPDDSLKDVAFKILENEVSMVPVINLPANNRFFPELLHLASLSGILSCICRHFKHSSSSLPILQQPICVIPLGTWIPKVGERNPFPLAMLRENASLISALSLLVQAQVSSIPIVDENNCLLDTYSRSDITALAKDKIYAHIRLDEMSIHQALQLGQDLNSPSGVFNGNRCQMCVRSDPLIKVMERLAIPGVRRVIVVEAGSKRVEGIISLTDVFRFLLG